MLQMSKKLLIATNNPGKLAEIRSFLTGLNLNILSLKDVRIDDDIEEHGQSYSENSLIKAKFYAKKSGLSVISDDGGIEIAALNNEPGVQSKRWIGENATEEDLVRHMIKVSKDLPDNNRYATFRTVVTFINQGGRAYQQEGSIEGIIAEKPHLKLLRGYPYRSFFFLPEIGKYYHENELTEDEMKTCNHRYKAIQKLIPTILKEFNLS
jgi:XTP/dITP diphosphohydrolase